MTKFIALSVSNLRLDYLEGLVSETITIATPQAGALGAVGAAKLTALTTTNTTFLALLHKQYASELTPQIAEKDQARDALFSEIKRTSKSASQSSLPAIRDSGKKLVSFLTPVWHIDKEPMMSQTALIGLLQARYAADPTLAQDVANLGLATQMQLLFSTNAALDNLYNSRLAEIGLDDDDPSASSLKSKLVHDYDDFCTTVEMTLSALPTPALQLVFNEMNDVRRKYIAHLPIPLNKDYTSVAPIPDEVHTGKHCTPLPRVFVVIDGKLVELVFSVDFTVTYRNNVNVGTAHLYIHGKGKYTGRYDTTFHIVNAQ